MVKGEGLIIIHPGAFTGIVSANGKYISAKQKFIL